MKSCVIILCCLVSCGLGWNQNAANNPNNVVKTQSVRKLSAVDSKQLWFEPSDGEEKFGRCGSSAPRLDNGKIAQCDPKSKTPCCSEWGFCGMSSGHCSCEKCVDYRKIKIKANSKVELLADESQLNMTFKIWWDWEDGEDKSGRCGESAPRINGRIAQCDPTSKNPCCSEWGFCGGSTVHCTCPKCVDYRKTKTDEYKMFESARLRKLSDWEVENITTTTQDHDDLTAVTRTPSAKQVEFIRTHVNCPFCTTKTDFDRAVTSQLLRELANTAKSLNVDKICRLFKIKAYNSVRYRTFNSYCELYNFLDGFLKENEMQNFGLGYYTGYITGAFVALKAWRNMNGLLETRIIDFRFDSSDEKRLQLNSLPEGSSLLFELEPPANNKSVYLGEALILDAKTVLRSNEWIDLTAIASSELKGKFYLSNSLRSLVLTKSMVPNKSFRLFDAVVEDEDQDDDGSDHTMNCEIMSAPKASSCQKRIVGYYTSWQTEPRFTVEHAKRLTHVIFAFMPMHANLTITDELGKSGLDRLKNLMLLAKTFAHLKVMFAVGGWENSQYFSKMAMNATARQVFIKSVIFVLTKWDFDGVDFDWEHPVTGGAVNGTAEDRENYVTLLKELRGQLDQTAKLKKRTSPYLVSFASAAGRWSLEVGYNLSALLNYADWVNVMTYDYYGAWQSQWGVFTGPTAPLVFGGPKNYSRQLNVEWTIKYHLCRINDTRKISMGVPFYGRYWKHIGDPVLPEDDLWRVARIPKGKKYPEGGELSYKEIKSKYLTNKTYEQHYHKKTKTPYMIAHALKMLITYENRVSLNAKVDFAVKHNLGGIMVWSIDQDDENLEMLNTVAAASLCTSSNKLTFTCPPMVEKRWWTWADDQEKAGLCGKNAPLYRGLYPICDPEDPGYNCCSSAGFCGSGPEYCDCPTCVNYTKNPEKIFEEPLGPPKTPRPVIV